MSMCFCMGPQNGQPLCPCMMQAKDKTEYLKPENWTNLDELIGRIDMNSNPNAEQQRFHNDLRELGCIVTGANQVQIHHIMGSKWKAKGFSKPGEWLVLPLCHDTHADIDNYSFEGERGLFLAMLRKYQLHYD